ncbi:MAG: hypothetical protein QOD86_471 [Miltoncostaeaceae bacterium]|jgi:quercetin dioxygenase-like cupin family protein|nr:hypothetical protein [Miltoncostaeaceae bacterium]
MSAATSDSVRLGAIEVRFLVEAQDSGGSASMFECAIPPDARVPAPHSHDAFEETVYGLEGVSTWTIDGAEHEIGPGQAVCIRRGAVHGFANRGAEPTRFLAVATPGIFGRAYFEDLAEVLAASAGGPPDLAAILAVMRRHGLTPAPPA